MTSKGVYEFNERRGMSSSAEEQWTDDAAKLNNLSQSQKRPVAPKRVSSVQRVSKSLGGSKGVHR
jgi:hypothetical protein